MIGTCLTNERRILKGVLQANQRERVDRHQLPLKTRVNFGIRLSPAMALDWSILWRKKEMRLCSLRCLGSVLDRVRSS